MGRRPTLDPEKKAAAAAKVKAQVAKAGQKRNEAKAATRVSQAEQDRTSFEDDVAFKLRRGAPKTGAPREQKIAAAIDAGVGPMAKDYYSPNSPLSANLRRQIGRTSRITSNPNHSIALDSIVEEIRSRLNHIVPQTSVGFEFDAKRTANYADRNNRLAVAHAHLAKAQDSILKHQAAHGRGDYAAALEHLTNATDGINDAVETSVNKPSLGLPRDVGLATAGESSATLDSNHLFGSKWRPGEQEWNEGESNVVNLHKVHSMLNGIRNGYITDLRASDKVGPAQVDSTIASSPNLSAGRSYKPGALSPTAGEVHEKVFPTLASAGVVSTKKQAQQVIRDAKDAEIVARRESATGILDKNKGMFLKEDDSPGSTARMATTLGLMSPGAALENYKKEVEKGTVKLPEGIKLGTNKAKKFLTMQQTPSERARDKARRAAVTTPDSEDPYSMTLSQIKFPEPEEESPQDFGDNLRPEAHSEGYVPEKAVGRRNAAFGVGITGGR